MSVSTESLRRKRFERVFDEHFRAVSAYARRRAAEAEAEDAVAETFLVAWRRLDEVPSDAKPWLLGVARRVLANQRRAAGRRLALAQRAGLERAAEPERRPILEALERLSESDRELLLLVAWDGLSPGEAAAALRCSRTAVKVRLHRARRRLRTELERLEPTTAAPAKTTRQLRLEEMQ
jgi:RNA polymerase sigma-70 factor (ECF subfamily)